MRNKILIGAGILLTVFIVFLIIICGASGGDKTVTQDELTQTIENVVCDVQDENSINYNISLLTNDTQFDNEILEKSYSQININTLKDFNSHGVVFRVRTTADTTLTFNLIKNDDVLSTFSVEALTQEIEDVNLVIDEAVSISSTDNFYITIENTNNATFVFDTLIFFFDEV